MGPRLLPFPLPTSFPFQLTLLLLFLLLRFLQSLTTWLTLRRRRRRRLPSSPSPTPSRLSPPRLGLLSGWSCPTSQLVLEPNQLSPSSPTSCSRTPSSLLTDSLY